MVVHMTSVLLVMDYQQGIVERAGSPGALDAASRAVAAARATDVPVFFIRVAFRAGYPEVASSNQSFGAAKDAAGDTMTETHPATQVHTALEPRADEPIVTKRRVSAFTGSDLDVLLRGARADHLVLAGISTSGVVLSTVREAADARLPADGARRRVRGHRSRRAPRPDGEGLPAPGRRDDDRRLDRHARVTTRPVTGAGTGSGRTRPAPIRAAAVAGPGGCSLGNQPRSVVYLE